MGLWDWTLEAYNRPGVAQACLTLQDDHNLNTSLLLWVVWARGPHDQALAQAVALTRRWDATVLSPIRVIRRAMKTSTPGVDDQARESLREDIKAAELRAERVLMESLEQIPGPGGERSPADALAAAAAAWGAAPCDRALATLAATLD